MGRYGKVLLEQELHMMDSGCFYYCSLELFSLFSLGCIVPPVALVLK